MTTSTCKLLRHATLGAVIGLGGIGAAQAGAVSTNFDPQFGPSLPNLSYKGTFYFSVTDACAGNAAGLVVVSTFSSCGGPITGNVALTLFDTGTPANSTTALFSLLIGSLQVQDGFVVGWNTTVSNYLPNFFGTTYAATKDFTFAYGSLPYLWSYDRCGGDDDCWTNPQQANRTGFQETIQHSGDNGQSRYGQDSNGVNIDYQVTLDNAGTPVYTPTGVLASAVPEPASLALVLGALMAGGLARRRAASIQAA